MNSEYVIEMKAITKRFAGVVANDHIDFNLKRGEIHAILGENGAGKTTLMNILSGMVQPDSGSISVKGQPARIRSPHDALALGIGMVYQHFTLVSTLSVIENLELSRGSVFFLRPKEAEQRVSEMMSETGFSIDPHSKTSHLSVGQQQRVEVLKALNRGSQVLVLDEPTSVLAPTEAEDLFKVLKKLTAMGKSVIFITHKLEEAVRISDRMTVLRLGKKIFEAAPVEQDRQRVTEQIVNEMFGSIRVQHNGEERQKPSDEIVLEVTDITANNDKGLETLGRLSLTVRKGEILGIAGVDGNGQKELAEVIAGQRKVKRGAVELDGVDITNRGIGFASRMGISYLTDDRMGEGCIGSLSVAENMIAKRFDQEPFSRNHFLIRWAISQNGLKLIQEFSIKVPGPWARVSTLSGGNIQKLLLARELCIHPKILVCGNPTHGLDLVTTRFIRDRIRLECRRGTAVILISSDLDEIIEASDRIGVIFNGKILSVFPRGEVGRERIGRLMLGITN